MDSLPPVIPMFDDEPKHPYRGLIIVFIVLLIITVINKFSPHGIVELVFGK